MIISINGPAGSGKSTIAKKLAEKLGWEYFYIGGIRREKAKELGMTLAEYNKLGETDPSTDIAVDQYQTELGKTRDNFIIEGRTSWHFIPHSLKIYLDVDENAGAERIYRELLENNERNEDIQLESVEAVLASNRRRKNSDIKRYRQYYNFDVYDTVHYDYRLDTTGLNQNQVFKKVYDYIKKKIEEH